MTTAERERATSSPRELEALIEEARNRQRRRRRRVALAILVTAGAGFGAVAFGGAGATHRPAVAAASPSGIRAFLATAERGLDRRYSVTYTVAVPRRSGPALRAEVIAAQLSRGRTFYRETPSFSAVSAEHNYEVFYGPNNDPHGIFSCRRAGASSAWSCVGPFAGIGMGGTFALQGPYPPQALVLGLENANATYTGRLATRPEPAFLVRRRLAGQVARCLQYGNPRHPLGSVCLNGLGLIASYRLPQAVTYSTYETATLQTYATHVQRDTFSLPAKAPRGSSAELLAGPKRAKPAR